MRMGNKGFSLVEVLVASFIMFIALAIFTSVFRGALISSERASDVVDTSAFTGLVVEKIAVTIKQNHGKEKLQGQEQILGKNYHWSASVIKQTQPPARYFGSQLVRADHTAKLWKVRLKLVDSDKVYEFEEISW